MIKRRDFLHATLATGVGALARGTEIAAQPAAPNEVSDRIGIEPVRQSVCRWTFRDMPLEELAAAARDIGIGSIELLDPPDWPVIQRYGLTCAMTNAAGPGGIPRGFNRVEHHEWLIPAYDTLIRQAADAGIPNVICFSGNRDGLPDEQGIENCARGVARLVPLAEDLGVTLAMELLNSKVNHPDYQCDHTAWGVALVERVGSERFKLLYDIYHMQIMEGDVIRTIRDNHQHIAHYHTAGVPGRNELDEDQELFYPAIMRAIKETGFTGFVGQEFLPTRDPLTSLREAVELCHV